MEKDKLLERLQVLEQDIDQLKSELEPPKQQNWFLGWCGSALRFLLSNWVLVGVVTAIIGVIVYQVNPLEDFQSIKTRRELSEFYRKEGDRLLERQYYEAAADAFGKAVDINSNNIQATYGMAKAEVFIPDDGQTYVSLGVVDSKLDYLLEAFPDDSQLYLLKGYQYQAQSDFENAAKSFQRAIDINQNFVHGYIALGVNNQYHLDSDETLQKTIWYYENALALDPDNVDAHSNIGYIYLLQGEYEKARIELEKANALSTNFGTILVLGEVHNYLGNSSYALQLHQWIKSALSDPNMAKDRSFMTGNWLFNYMPSEPDDFDTIVNYVVASPGWQTETLLHYALSFDYALARNRTKADSEFDIAHQLDLSHQYTSFIASKMASLENFLSEDFDKETQLWFDAHWLQLWSS